MGPATRSSGRMHGFFPIGKKCRVNAIVKLQSTTLWWLDIKRAFVCSMRTSNFWLRATNDGPWSSVMEFLLGLKPIPNSRWPIGWPRLLLTTPNEAIATGSYRPRFPFLMVPDEAVQDGCEVPIPAHALTVGIGVEPPDQVRPARGEDHVGE